MFCVNCGAQLSDNSKFCPNCGTSVFGLENADKKEKKQNYRVNFVQATCTNCGAALEVDPDKKKAVCPFCNGIYIVEEAINKENYSAEDNSSDVRKDDNTLFYVSNALYENKPGKLMLKSGRLVFENNAGTQESFCLEKMHKIRNENNGLVFMYDDTGEENIFKCSQPVEFAMAICNAKKGNYTEGVTEESVEEYIVKNFDSSTKVKAAMYYMECFRVSAREAKQKIDELIK